MNGAILFLFKVSSFLHCILEIPGSVGDATSSCMTVIGEGGKIRTPPVGGPPSPRDFIVPLFAFFISSLRKISSCCLAIILTFSFTKKLNDTRGTKYILCGYI